eukprot:1336403-Amorphochlora_amoeboformis.AAC.1
MELTQRCNIKVDLSSTIEVLRDDMFLVISQDGCQLSHCVFQRQISGRVQLVRRLNFSRTTAGHPTARGHRVMDGTLSGHTCRMGQPRDIIISNFKFNNRMAVGVYIFALAGLTAARWAAAPLELSPPSNASSNSSSLASIEKPTSMVDPVPQLTPGSGEYTRPWQDAVVRSIESQGREDKQKAVSEMKQKESKKEHSSDSSPSSASRSTKSDPKSSLPPDALHTGNESGESVPRGSLILPNEEDHQQANKTAEMPARNSEHEGGGIVQRAMTQLLETTSRLTAYYENKQDR